MGCTSSTVTNIQIDAVPNKDVQLISASDDYSKPDGWKTLTSVEYGFTVDYPEDWSVNPGGKNIGSNTNAIIRLTSPSGNIVSFNIYRFDTSIGEEPYPAIPFEEQLVEISDNQEMIQRGGDAFKYFKGIYSLEVDDDIIRILPPSQDRTDVDFFDQNYIFISLGEQESKGDISTMKEIIRSFKR